MELSIYLGLDLGSCRCHKQNPGDNELRQSEEATSAYLGAGTSFLFADAPMANHLELRLQRGKGHQ